MNNTNPSKVKILREQKGLMQKELGHAIRITMQRINGIEKGRNKLSFERAILIASFFNVSFDYLDGRCDTP